MKRRKSIWERYEAHAIYDTKSPRKKTKTPTDRIASAHLWLCGSAAPDCG